MTKIAINVGGKTFETSKHFGTISIFLVPIGVRSRIGTIVSRPRSDAFQTHTQLASWSALRTLRRRRFANSRKKHITFACTSTSRCSGNQRKTNPIVDGLNHISFELRRKL